MYFDLNHFSFTFTIHIAYNDTRVQRHNSFGPFGDVITEFDSSSLVF
jgi:hypothetical protein